MLPPAPIPTTPSRLGDDWWKEASISLQAVIGENLVSPPSGTVIAESRLSPAPSSGRALPCARRPSRLWGDVLRVCRVRPPALGYP